MIMDWDSGSGLVLGIEIGHCELGFKIGNWDFGLMIWIGDND